MPSITVKSMVPKSMVPKSTKTGRGIFRLVICKETRREFASRTKTDLR